jgi:hypothetical protein
MVAAMPNVAQNKKRVRALTWDISQNAISTLEVAM